MRAIHANDWMNSLVEAIPTMPDRQSVRVMPVDRSTRLAGSLRTWRVIGPNGAGLKHGATGRSRSACLLQALRAAQPLHPGVLGRTAESFSGLAVETAFRGRSVPEMNIPSPDGNMTIPLTTRCEMQQRKHSASSLLDVLSAPVATRLQESRLPQHLTMQLSR